MVITEKEKLTKPLSFILKKGKSVGGGSSSDDSPSAASPKGGTGAVVIDPERALLSPPVLAPEDAVSNVSSDAPERGTWGSNIDFAMSCIAYAVGLGNVWRFPYLCFKNGGGAFLIPYFVALMTCGVPLFLLEVSMGQYLGVGGMNVVGQLCPIFKGVGYSALTMVFLENVYYIIIVSWTLFYILNTMYSIGDGLPWASCEKGFGTWANGSCFDPEAGIPFAKSDAHLKYNHKFVNQTQTPVEAYWNNEVLQISDGLEEVGGIRWELCGYLALAWLAAFLVVWKGLHGSGKIIWFSAMFPYVVLTTLAIKALSLEGAWEGIKFLFTPDWERLTKSECWIDGGTQIFYSYGVGIGALLALGSYNKFNHNCYRDTFIVCTINSATSFYASIIIFSILGFMAHAKDVTVDQVVKGGPGLAFLVFPEVVLQLQPSWLWSILFFVMLLALGFDSQFCILESLICGLVDNWPKVLRPHRLQFTICMVIFMFLLGIPMITNGGVYLFQLMDFYCASGMSLLWCCFFQTVAICWIYGADKVYDNIHHMIGTRINKLWYWCWMIASPAFMLSIFIFYFVKYTPIKYTETYHYPGWGEALGFMISLSSMIWVPAYAIYYLLTTKGSLRERLRKGIKPAIKMRSDAVSKKMSIAPPKEVEMNLMTQEVDTTNHV